MQRRHIPLLAITLAVVVLAPPGHSSSAADPLPDMDIDARRVELSGEHSFGAVTVRNGGELAVAPYAGVAGGGRLTLTAKRLVVDATSRITADGAGWRGRVAAKGEGPGGGEGGEADLARRTFIPLHPTGSGAGGGYGGRGGDGIHLDTRGEWRGGRPYGTVEGTVVELGSAGGGPVRSHHETVNYPGGNGGGAITLRADELMVLGRISADGAPGPAGEYDSGGGGSGGGISITAQRFTLTGTVSVRGGPGGASQDVGGHGGGGRIKLFYQQGTVDPARFDLRPGHGPCPGADAKSPAGCDGTLYIERLPTPSKVYLPRTDRLTCVAADRRAIVIVIDASDSMAESAPAGGSLLQLTLGAVDSFLDLLAPTDRVALVSFHADAVLQQALTSDRARLRQALKAVRPAHGSRIDEGMRLALAALDAAYPSESAEFVVLSDGRWDAKATETAAGVAATARGRGAVGHAVGVGTVADAAALRRLTGDARNVWLVPDGREMLPVMAAFARAGPCSGTRP
jgi:hypothetical protein